MIYLWLILAGMLGIAYHASQKIKVIQKRTVDAATPRIVFNTYFSEDYPVLLSHILLLPLGIMVYAFIFGLEETDKIPLGDWYGYKVTILKAKYLLMAAWGFCSDYLVMLKWGTTEEKINEKYGYPTKQDPS